MARLPGGELTAGWGKSDTFLCKGLRRGNGARGFGRTAYSGGLGAEAPCTCATCRAAENGHSGGTAGRDRQPPSLRMPRNSIAPGNPIDSLRTGMGRDTAEEREVAMAAPKSVVDENALNIYTDGSSFPGPRRGGIGIRYVTVDAQGNEVIDDLELPGYPGANSIQMELYACTVALKEAIRSGLIYGVERVIIYTDCQYVRDSYPRATFEWSRARWKNRDGKPVENADLWKEFLRIARRLTVRLDIRWEKGHSKSVHNKAADKMARRSANNALNPPLKPVGARRKTSDHQTIRGSVEMLGQELDVRIVTAEWMRPQRVHKYRYQVLSKDSVYVNMMDVAYSTVYLREGHHYTVRVNEDQKHPQFVEVVAEIEQR